MSISKFIAQLELNKFVESTTVSGRPGVVVVNSDGSNIGSATIYAIVNTGAIGNQNSLATLLAGPNQIGSVTVSNPVQLAAGSNYVGLATVTVGNTVNALLQAGSSYV